MKNFIARHLQKLMVVPALVLALGLSGVGVLTAPSAVSAADCDTDSLSIAGGADCSKTAEQSSDLFGSSEDSIFKKVSRVLLFIIGAIAVIMLIFGGVRYVVSGGNDSQVKAAKDTILYAIVGILVALLAYAAVNFVIDSFVAN